MIFTLPHVQYIRVCEIQYFFILGISYSGSGIGTMIFNPLARILLDTFGWRGTMFIYASFTLNMCVFGSLQRPFVAAEDTQEIVSLEVTDNLKQQHYNPSEQLDDVAAEINTTVTVADRLNGDGNKLVEPLETNLSYDKDVVADDEIANTKEHNIRETNAVKDDYYKVLKNQCDNEICVNAPLLNNPKGDICQCSLQKSVTIPNENASTENEPMLRCVSNGLAFQKKNGRDKANQTVSQTHEFNKTEHMRTFNKVDHSEISETIKSLPNIHKRTLLSDVLKPKLHESLTSLQSLKRPPLIVSQNILGSSASFDILVERQQCSVTEKTFHNENNEKTKMTNIFATLICSAFPKELVTNANFIILMVATFFYGVAAYIPIALLPAYCLYVGCRIEKTGWLISLFGVTGR